MAALQKFKLLATQCGVAQSPTRSPRTSPVIHLRRRKTTLRMFLTRSSSRRSPPRQIQAPPLPPRHIQAPPLPPRHIQAPPLPPPSPPCPLPERKRGTLKDLFGSKFGEDGEDNEGKGTDLVGFGGKCEVFKMRVNYGLVGELGSSSPRPGWIGFRHKSLIRRAWRPKLLAIPEVD